MDQSYRLRCNLVGHDKDVRTVSPSVFPPCGIISGSRDVTTRIWIPTEDSNSFMEGAVMSGHNGFVACVCAIPPNEEHPQGLIATGSNDSTINIYSIDSPSPIHKLEGHTNTVCSLAAGKFGTLISGSWDQTAKVWLNTKNVMTLKGHNLAVWCVLMMQEKGYMVTGSADKTVKVWKAGKCEHTLKGHEDCVRGLAAVNDAEFLSCSNDSSIRRWTVSGHVLQVYYSHMNFVYGVAVLPHSDGFVSVSEDRSLKVWRGGECVQTITHPCTSVWSVCVLDNGDIVTGSSDAVVRVFTMAMERAASSEEMEAFEQQVSASKIPTQVGDIDVDKLPGPEVLLAPGKKDGATQMVRQGTSVEAHQWSAAQNQWTKVGDVVGSSGGSSGTKTIYEGEEYDFVFSVDVEEGKPPLKLPYNMTEDPWQAAQKFITKHGLSQLFLDQVHNFIVENTRSMSMSQLPAGQSYRDPFTGSSSYVPGSSSYDSGSFSDPFTGGGRYIPPTTDSSTAAHVPAQGADPFTGSGSYRPTEAVEQASNGYFPQSEVITFNAIKADAVLGKLKEFNSKLPTSSQSQEGDLSAIVQICDIDRTPSPQMIGYLWRLLNWPREYVFPAVDILRAALRNKSTNGYFCSAEKAPAFLEYLSGHLDPENSVQNQTVALRAFANLACQHTGQQVLLANRENLLPLVSQATASSNKNVQTAASTILLNYSVLLRKSDDVEARSDVLTALSKAAQSVIDNEAMFRLCVAVGTLVGRDEEYKVIAQSLGLDSAVSEWKTQSALPKLVECATALEKNLN